MGAFSFTLDISKTSVVTIYLQTRVLHDFLLLDSDGFLEEIFTWKFEYFFCTFECGRFCNSCDFSFLFIFLLNPSTIDENTKIIKVMFFAVLGNLVHLGYRNITTPKV